MVLVPIIDIYFPITHPELSETLEQTKKPSCSIYVFIGPFAAALGVAFLEFGGLERISYVDLLLLSTPIAFAMCFHKSELLAKAYPGDTRYTTGVQLATVSLLSLFWTAAVHAFPFQSNNAATWRQLSQWRLLGGLVYTGIITTAWTSYIEQRAIKVLSAADTTLMYSLEPLFATAISAILIGEHIGVNTVVGALCIVFACVWSAVGPVPLCGSWCGMMRGRQQSFSKSIQTVA